jgi:hypothetical protein
MSAMSSMLPSGRKDLSSAVSALHLTLGLRSPWLQHHYADPLRPEERGDLFVKIAISMQLRRFVIESW